MRYRASKHSPDRRDGIVDMEFYEVARDRYDAGDAATYHGELSERMSAEGWSDYDIARTHLDIAEAITDRPAIEASWSAAGGQP